MSQTNEFDHVPQLQAYATQYPNADTSRERLTEITNFINDYQDQDEFEAQQRMLAMYRKRNKMDSAVMGYDLLAMLEERTFAIHHNAELIQNLRQQLHDQRWRRQSVDGMPDFGVPVQLRLRGSLDHAQLKKGYMGAPIYQTQDGFKHSPELKDGEEIWWRPIPPLPVSTTEREGG